MPTDQEWADFKETNAREHGELKEAFTREHGELRETNAREHGELKEAFTREHSELKETNAREHSELKGRIDTLEAKVDGGIRLTWALFLLTLALLGAVLASPFLDRWYG